VLTSPFKDAAIFLHNVSLNGPVLVRACRSLTLENGDRRMRLLRDCLLQPSPTKIWCRRHHHILRLQGHKQIRFSKFATSRASTNNIFQIHLEISSKWRPRWIRYVLACMLRDDADARFDRLKKSRQKYVNPITKKTNARLIGLKMARTQKNKATSFHLGIA
jgi:hypothetical protein